MKPIILTFLIMVFFAASFYSVSTIANKSTPLRIKTNQKLISIQHTEGDTFSVDLLFNTKHSMYVYEEAMVTHRLVAHDGTRSLPISLVAYAFSEVKDEGFELTLTYAMDIEDASDLIHLEDARLTILYTDDTRLSIPIGEFAYHYDSISKTTLDYTSSTPIRGEYGYGSTVVGQCIGLRSKSESDIQIRNITLFSSHIQPNMDYLVEHGEAVNPLMDMAAILTRPFNPKNISLAPETLTLKAKGKTTVCLPFSTTKNLTVDRYPVGIHYLEAGVEKTLVIDDFTYADHGMNGVRSEGVMRYGTLE